MVSFTWYEIEPDEQPVRCSHCGKFTASANCVYVTRDDGGPDNIVERNCLRKGFLERWPQGHPDKGRTIARIWQTRKPKLKLVHSRKPFKVGG